MYAVPDVAERVRTGKAMTYGDAGRYILLELPPSHVPPYLERVLFDLRVTSRITPSSPIPSGMPSSSVTPTSYGLGVRGGVAPGKCRQPASRGASGWNSSEASGMGAVHILASDAHGLDRRPPLRVKDFERTVALAGEPATRRLLWDNPAAVRRAIPSRLWNPSPRLVRSRTKGGGWKACGDRFRGRPRGQCA